LNNLVRIIFYGNIFYGFCALAMSIETNLIHGYSLNEFPFYLLVFFGSWIYYTMIYVRSTSAHSTNPRIVWYRQNFRNIKRVLYCIVIIEFLLLIAFISMYFQGMFYLSNIQWMLVLSVPLVAALYTFNIRIGKIKKFRQIGWLKPLVIGYTWTGWVTIYPLIIWQMQYAPTQHFKVLPHPLYWLQNFIFITILAIIFDVKDYKSDLKSRLRTFPTRLGIVSTFRWIILPVTIINIIIVSWFQWHHFSWLQSCIQLIPFGLLLWIAMKHQNQRNILYYLVAIDGLMLLKGICGIISVLYL
jgi:4-hydroxybenzoate polyprenyltransferase